MRESPGNTTAGPEICQDLPGSCVAGGPEGGAGVEEEGKIGTRLQGRLVVMQGRFGCDRGQYRGKGTRRHEETLLLGDCAQGRGQSCLEAIPKTGQRGSRSACDLPTR